MGQWSGTVTQTWAQVNANPLALECIPQSISMPSTISIEAYPFSISSHAGSSTAAGANTYIFPPYAGLNGTWSKYDGSTASIRVSSTNTLECLSMVREGNTLKTVLLGGSGFSVTQQCSSTAASLVPSAFSKPYCSSLPNTVRFLCVEGVGGQCLG